MAGRAIGPSGRARPARETLRNSDAQAQTFADGERKELSCTVLTSVTSELVSREFALLPLAARLGRASKDAWSRGGTVL